MDKKTKQLVEDAEARVVFVAGEQYLQKIDKISSEEIAQSIWDDEDAEFMNADLDLMRHGLTDIPTLCSAIREQDKRARHAEEERDAVNKRIAELEVQCENVELEHAASWFAFEKEALDAIGDEIIGMAVDAGADIPGMIKKIHEHYGKRLRVAEERCEAAEKQRDTYKRIASIKKTKA